MPEAGTGQYQLELEVPGWTEEHSLTVEPTKISREAYLRLLEDLETRLPVSVALGLQRVGALAGVHFRPPGESTVGQEVVRLRRAVLGTPDRPGLAKVLVELSLDPHRVLSSNELWAPRERARRLHPARLPQALSLRSNLARDGRPERVLDTRVEHTVDVYENRLVKAYFQQVHLRLRRLIRALSAGPFSDVSEQGRLLLDQLLRARRRATFLDEVQLPVHLPTRLTMVLLRRPPYRVALEGYLEFRRSAVVRLDDSRLDAPLVNLSGLYQTWGTLEVISVLLEVAVELGYRVKEQRLVGRDASGFYVRVLPRGKPAVLMVHPDHRTEINLTAERTYSSQRGGELYSVSCAQQPDVTVEVRPSHSPPRLYLFDPKYKLQGEFLEAESGDGSPKKVDIDKMHAYRDAIRDEEGERPVRYAAILYPGPPRAYTEGLEAITAYPGLEQALERRVRKLMSEALNPAI